MVKVAAIGLFCLMGEASVQSLQFSLRLIGAGFTFLVSTLGLAQSLVPHPNSEGVAYKTYFFTSPPPEGYEKLLPKNATHFGVAKVRILDVERSLSGRIRNFDKGEGPVVLKNGETLIVPILKSVKVELLGIVSGTLPNWAKQDGSQDLYFRIVDNISEQQLAELSLKQSLLKTPEQKQQAFLIKIGYDKFFWIYYNEEIGREYYVIFYIDSDLITKNRKMLIDNQGLVGLFRMSWANKLLILPLWE